MNKTLTIEEIKQLWNKYGINPDKELLEWERWVQIRKDETMHLAKQTRRPPVDLVMNLLEKTREEKEWKTILEHAQLEKKLGIRGSLWESPPRLAQRCYCEPVYELQRTAAEVGRPHIIEHIGVPHEIQTKEKGLTGYSERRTEYKLNDEFKKYKQKREAELEVKINKIDPCKSQMKHLLVKGKGYNKPSAPVPSLPLISVSQYISNYDLITSVYALRINNTLIIKDIPGQDVSYLNRLKKKYFNDPCTTWSYYFNIPVNKVGRNKVYLENYGTVTLRYFWKKIKRPIPFISENMSENVFFFNKNEEVLFPGQSRQIYLTFISDQPGIFQEHWEISTCNVHFFNNQLDRLGVNLYGDCTEDLKNIKNKVADVQNYIRKTDLEYLIRDIIFDPLEKAFMVKPLRYPYRKMLSEADTFVLHNPICFYHQTEVDKLKTAFEEMFQNEEWNLAISSWRSKIFNEPFENRMRLYTMIKTSFSELLKPWYEENDIPKQKHQAVRILLGNLADEIDKEYLKLWFVFYQQPALEKTESRVSTDDPLEKDPTKLNVTIHNLFSMYVHLQVVNTIEQCAGVLSSIDSNRYIKFNFCKKH